MANALSSMIQREQSTDAEKRNALAPDPGWTAPKLEGVPSRWTTESDAPWLHRLARDAKEVGDASARVILEAPNKFMMAVSDRSAPEWALRNLTPAGQMIQGANQFAAGLRGTEVAENIWDQPEPLADAPWMQRAGNMATGLANMALAYAPMETAVGGAVGEFGAKIADKWPMQKGIYVGPKSKTWTTRPQVGLEGETVPEGAFSSLYDQKPRLEIDDSEAVFNPEISKNNLSTIKAVEDFKLGFGRDANVEDILYHDKLYGNYPDLGKIKLMSGSPKSEGASFNANLNQINIDTGFGMKQDDHVKKQLTHELQHAIQEKESFARGGSPQEFYLPMKRHIKDLNEEIGEINERLKKAVGTNKYNDLLDLRDDLRKELLKIEGTSGLRHIEKGHEQYRRLAGEIEARDSAARTNMTMAERRATPPYSSENVPLEDAIVRFDRDGPSMSVPKNLKEEPKWSLFGSEDRKKLYDPDKIKASGQYKIWDHDAEEFHTFASQAEEDAFREENPFRNLAERPADNERIWYRFGPSPESNRSYNFSEQKAEPGVSVYATKTGSNPFFSDRPLYSGKGVQIGWGSDGEPVVIPTSKWKKSSGTKKSNKDISDAPWVTNK